MAGNGQVCRVERMRWAIHDLMNVVVDCLTPVVLCNSGGMNDTKPPTVTN